MYTIKVSIVFSINNSRKVLIFSGNSITIEFENKTWKHVRAHRILIQADNIFISTHPSEILFYDLLSSQDATKRKPRNSEGFNRIFDEFTISRDDSIASTLKRSAYRLRSRGSRSRGSRTRGIRSRSSGSRSRCRRRRRPGIQRFSALFQ